VKGILLAGGAGTRLFPSTNVISKQLLPVYDKPAIYYPLSILMLAGIRDVLIISTPRDLDSIRALLGSGQNLGMNFSYRIQAEPKGIPEAFLIGHDFVDRDGVCLILGDNLFYGNSVPQLLRQSLSQSNGATVFAYHVNDPQRFGVVEIDPEGRALSIEEKPSKPKSNWALTGLYKYDDRVCSLVEKLKPSSRGEIEISDLNQAYLSEGALTVRKLGRGVAWLDTGTPDSLLASSVFVQTIEQRQGLKIACLEEIAYLQGYITFLELQSLASAMPNCEYRNYLQTLSQV